MKSIIKFLITLILPLFFVFSTQKIQAAEYSFSWNAVDTDAKKDTANQDLYQFRVTFPAVEPAVVGAPSIFIGTISYSTASSDEIKEASKDEIQNILKLNTLSTGAYISKKVLNKDSEEFKEYISTEAVSKELKRFKIKKETIESLIVFECQAGTDAFAEEVAHMVSVALLKYANKKGEVQYQGSGNVYQSPLKVKGYDLSEIVYSE